MAISIQVIKRKITLSVLSMDKDKKFVFEARHSATIPISYQERYTVFLKIIDTDAKSKIRGR